MKQLIASRENLMTMLRGNLLFIVAFLCATIGLGEELPKSGFGRYGGEMPGYTVEKNGMIINIDEHDVFITIDREKITYNGGQLELSGTYSVFRQSKHEYALKATLTNGKSLTYEIDLVWHKKEKKLYMTAKNGQSEAVLEKMK